MALLSGEFEFTSERGVADGAVAFSDLLDKVNLSGFTTTRGKPIRMMGGSDEVILSNIQITIAGKYDNNVNGNLGNDLIKAPAGSPTRDLIRGGAEGDVIDCSLATEGGDWLAGGAGADVIRGGKTIVGWNVLRGNRGNDTIFGEASNDVLIGDFGRDLLQSRGGTNIFLMRTDDFVFDGVREQNATQNASDCDEITDYVAGFDRIVIPGVQSFEDLELSNSGSDVLISCSNFTNGTTGRRFIARVKAETALGLQLETEKGRGIIIGDKADAFFAQLNTDTFLGNANLPTDLL